MNKKILFLTGTRADYGKMKPLIAGVEETHGLESHIFVTGMHTMKKYGSTKEEIVKDGFKNVHFYMNQIVEEPMDLVLANTINGLGRYIREIEPDMIVVHGDRLETLSGAIVGAFNNIYVAHVEGGEVSGTIDESIRHSVTKLAHMHFVSNDDAKLRLMQMGEAERDIYVIGSPDMDILFKESLTSLLEVKKRYEIKFDDYAILIFHPVTTEVKNLRNQARNLVDAVINSGDNYIVIYPNNDLGQNQILEEFNRLNNNKRFRIFPSIRFEYFIELLKNSQYIIGNSSVGIHEAPALGIPTVNIGSRQHGRFTHDSIFNASAQKEELSKLIEIVKSSGPFLGTKYFGEGNSKDNFLKVILEATTWEKPKQKKFIDR